MSRYMSMFIDMTLLKSAVFTMGHMGKFSFFCWIFSWNFVSGKKPLTHIMKVSARKKKLCLFVLGFNVSLTLFQSYCDGEIRSNKKVSPKSVWQTYMKWTAVLVCPILLYLQCLHYFGKWWSTRSSKYCQTTWIWIRCSCSHLYIYRESRPKWVRVRVNIWRFSLSKTRLKRLSANPSNLDKLSLKQH